MSDIVFELAQQGIALAPADRERLVALLLDSLDDPAASEMDPAWAAELARRLAEYDRGGVEAIDGDVVLAEARRLAR